MMKLYIIVTLFLIIIFSHVTFAQNEPSHKFLLSGYGFTNLEKEENGDAQFEVGFNPIFLWSINNQILFEGELEFELEDNTTAMALEYAQILYVANEYITFGAGKFLSPNNIFSERYHPAWVNKLPNMPLGLSSHGTTQLLSGTQIGAQIRGGIPAGSMKFVYSVYVSNGPALNVEEEDHDTTGLPKSNSSGSGFNNITSEGGDGDHGAATTGTLSFGNIPDNNSDKGIGGRIGFLPVPELEIGYGFETAKVGTDDTEFSDVRSFNNVVDLSYVQDIKSLAGRIDLRSQYTWLNIDNPGIDHLDYENKSTAWYAQIAYQPYYLESTFLKNWELVARYDQIDLPEEAELNIDQKRITVGLNYWLNHSTVLKFAFGSTTSEHEDETETESSFIFQLAMGF